MIPSRGPAPEWFEACLPPLGERSKLEGLSDREIQKLARWLKIWHPDTFELCLRQISEDRAFTASHTDE